jgi:hypothetical protein
MKKIAISLWFCTLAVSAQTVLPERFEERFEIRTIRHSDGRVEVHKQTTAVEEPGVELRQVRIGDIVRAGHLNPHPVIKDEFVYMQSRCRWFRDLVQYQVIACQLQPNVWQVIDKF